jgi:hypothetical protein
MASRVFLVYYKYAMKSTPVQMWIVPLYCMPPNLFDLAQQSQRKSGRVCEGRVKSGRSANRRARTLLRLKVAHCRYTCRNFLAIFDISNTREEALHIAGIKYIFLL